VLFAIWLLVTWQIAPGWYSKWVIPEGYGILEFSQFVTMLAALFIAVRLLFKPFVRKRPFVFAVTIISALSCLYIAGEEMSWGQHFFHWKTPEYWAMVNRQEETNLHNIYPDLPRFRAMATGGSRDWRRDRRHHRADCRSLLPAHPRQPAVAVPATGSSIAYAVIAMLFKFTGILSQKGYMPELVHRPSEAVELYLYYFILGYLIIYLRAPHQRARSLALLKRGFEPLQRLLELGGGRLGLGLPLALLLDHVLGRAADELLVRELGIELLDLGSDFVDLALEPLRLCADVDDAGERQREGRLV
jgi:hypothetical protein